MEEILYALDVVTKLQEWVDSGYEPTKEDREFLCMACIRAMLDMASIELCAKSVQN